MELNFLVLFILLAGFPIVSSVPFNGIGVPISNVNAKNVIPSCYIVVYHGKAMDEDDILGRTENLLTFIR